MGQADVLVFAERREGQIKRPVLEALTAARKLATAHGGEVSALALGPGAAAHAAVAGQYGARRLLVVEAPGLELYAPEAYAVALAAAARHVEAAVVLVPATAMGRDLAPRAAARLATGCLSDVTDLEFDPRQGLRARRPVYSGKAIATVAIPKARPAFATLRPNVFPAEPTESPPAAVEPLQVAELAATPRVRVVRVEKAARGELDVAEAAIVVSGGRGLRAPENFKLVRELAEVLGAAVGASRAVVDAGWIPHAHQVGQTGKVVSPQLYIACGISGAIQHLAGMSSAKVIVAINKDPQAPIFKIATYGVVGDLFEILPRLSEAIRRLKAEG